MSRKLLWTIFRKDIGRKLTALFLAVFSWYLLDQYVSMEARQELPVRLVASRTEAERELVVAPAVYVVVPPELVERGLSAEQVRVDVKGLKAVVSQLKLGAVLDVPPDAIRDDDNGDFRFVLDVDVFRSDGSAVPVLSEFVVQPQELVVHLTHRETIDFDLRPRNLTPVGMPKAGYVYDPESCVIRPNQVRLSGPRSAILEIARDPTQLKLAAIDIDGQSFEVSREVGLDRERVDRGVQLLTAGRVVEVTLLIRPEDVTRELLSVPVHYANADDLTARGWKVLSKTDVLDLTVSGPPHVLEGLDEKELRGRIHLLFDWKGRDLRQANEPVRILNELPDSVSFTDRDGRAPRIHDQLDSIEDEAAATAPGDDAP